MTLTSSSWSTVIQVSLNKFIHEKQVYPPKKSTGRRPWATTISSSGPHNNFLLFRQTWVTTISSSVAPHLILPGKTTFMIYLGPLKCDFQKSSHITQKIYLNLYIKVIPLNVNCKTFFVNLNFDFHKKWLICDSNMNIKNDAP